MGLRVGVRGRGRGRGRVRAHEVDTEYGIGRSAKGRGSQVGLSGGGSHVLYDGLDVAPSPG